MQLAPEGMDGWAGDSIAGREVRRCKKSKLSPSRRSPGRLDEWPLSFRAMDEGGKSNEVEGLSRMEMSDRIRKADLPVSYLSVALLPSVGCRSWKV